MIINLYSNIVLVIAYFEVSRYIYFDILKDSPVINQVKDLGINNFRLKLLNISRLIILLTNRLSKLLRDIGCIFLKN